MRFLKNKIRLAQEALERKQQRDLVKTTPTPEEALSAEGRVIRPCASFPEHIWAFTFTKPTKNMIMNYSKTIFSFVTSDLAKPYIHRHFYNEAFDIDSFNDFVDELKPRTVGYKDFENVFVIREDDNEEIALYRKVLKMLAMVFMKYYSVSWIINGKITHKLVYLKNRYSIMRRITKDPIFLF